MMRAIIVWILIILTLALVGWFWVKPTLAPSTPQFAEMHKLSKALPEYVLPPEHYTPAPAPPPPTFYQNLKTELMEWGKILGPFSPFITIIMAFMVKRRKRR